MIWSNRISTLSSHLKFYCACICCSCTCGLQKWLVSAFTFWGKLYYPLVITQHTINIFAWMADSCALPCIPCRYLRIEVLTFSYIVVFFSWISGSLGLFGFRKSVLHISPLYSAIAIIGQTGYISVAGTCAFISVPANVLFNLKTQRVHIDLPDKLVWDSFTESVLVSSMPTVWVRFYILHLRLFVILC